jgi:hypothetical protein
MVAQLEQRGEPAALLDNHSTANLLWQLVPESRRFDEAVMDRLTELRTVLLDAAAEVTGPEHSIVFTNFVPAHRPATLLEQHRSVAERLGRPFVCVVLRCDPDEVLRRVANADRADRLKLTDVSVARRVMDDGMTVPDWPDIVHLDTTGLSPDATAERILALAD